MDTPERSQSGATDAQRLQEFVKSQSSVARGTEPASQDITVGKTGVNNIWDMYQHIIDFTGRRWLTPAERAAVDDFHRIKAIAVGSGSSMIDEDGPHDLDYHMRLLDSIFFAGSMKGLVKIEWNKEFAKSRLRGKTTPLSGSEKGTVLIQILPQKLDGKDQYDDCSIFGVILHELLHAIEVLPGLTRNRFIAVHFIGLSGHGQLFRYVGRLLQGAAGRLLTGSDWYLNVDAYGPSHNQELKLLGNLDPSTKKNRGWKKWDFDVLEGRSEPRSSKAKPDAEAIYNISHGQQGGYAPEVEAIATNLEQSKGKVQQLTGEDWDAHPLASVSYRSPRERGNTIAGQPWNSPERSESLETTPEIVFSERLSI
ncbi:MAG: hypothetical protein Q9200_007108 [Gallowayella weberi]